MKDTIRFRVCIPDKNHKEAKIRINIPDWVYETSVSANDKEISKEDGYWCIEGIWEDNESFSYTCRCKVTSKGLPDCKNVFAFFYGPVLLSADLGIENMIDSSTGVEVTIPSDKIAGNEVLKVSDGSVSDYINAIDSHMERHGETLSFDLEGADRKLVFSPHYKKARERYGIYWYFE